MYKVLLFKRGRGAGIEYFSSLWAADLFMWQKSCCGYTCRMSKVRGR